MLNKIMDKDRKKQQLLKSLSDRDWEGDIYTYPHSMAYRLHNGNISFSDVWNGTKELNMYIHIPFCPGKCSYCGLFSLGCADEKIISEYVLALSREIVYYAEILKGARIREMFIGGGTPNMLSLEQLTFLLREIELNFNVNISEIDICLECHPSFLTENYIKSIKNLGIGRISIGMQSFCTNELEISNRVYKAPIVVNIAEWCHKYDLPFNLDLIIGLPKQDEENMWYNIAQAINFQPQSITLYPLTIVKGTPFETQIKSDDIMSTRHIIDLMPTIIDYFAEKNFSYQSNVSFFNNTYHIGKKFLKVGSLDIKYPCLGIGAGARSYADKMHYSMIYSTNQEDIRKVIQEYICIPTEERKYISFPMSLDENKRRYTMLSLIDGGLNLTDYFELFKSVPKNDFEDEFAILEELELIVCNDKEISLSRKGIVYADILIRIFISAFVNRRYALKKLENDKLGK